MGYFLDSQSNLEAAVRRKCGSPDTTLLTAAELTECLTKDALGRLNALCPRLNIGTITTVADQDDYKISGSDGTGIVGLRGVKKVLYARASTGYFSDEFSDLVSLGLFSPIEEGLSIFDNPALAETFFHKSAEYGRRFDGRAKILRKSDGTYIRLIPAPGSDGETIPFWYYMSRTLADCEYHFQEPLLELAVGYCKQIMAERISMAPETTMGAMKVKSSGATLERAAKRHIKNAEARLRKPSRIQQQGD